MPYGNTQISDPLTYNVKSIVYEDPITSAVSDTIKVHRINIQTRNPDGTIGDLVLPTETVFSYGVQESTSQETKEVIGWTFPLSLYNRDGPTEYERGFVRCLESIVDAAIQHTLDVCNDLGIELSESELKKRKGGLSPLFWKLEPVKDANGRSQMKIVDGTGPTIYPKLIYSKKSEKFLSHFYDIDDNPIDPLTLMGKYCRAKCALKIESIFIGVKYKLQVKIVEAVEVEPVQSGMKRLLSARPRADPIVHDGTTGTGLAALGNGSSDDRDETGSLDEAITTRMIPSKKPPASDDVSATPATTAKRVVRKVTPKATS